MSTMTFTGPLAPFSTVIWPLEVFTGTVTRLVTTPDVLVQFRLDTIGGVVPSG